MKISIIILTKNAQQTLSLILNNIFHDHYHFKLEAIVIDSGSTDRTVEITRSYPVKLIKQSPEAFHHSRTRNMGAYLATGKILVFLNGDAYPVNKDWLPVLISHFTDTDVGAVYSRQIPPPGTDPINKFRVAWHYNKKRAFKSRETISTFGSKYTFFFSTVSCAIRKTVWECFKFPEDISVYEDTALIRRVIDSGYKVVYEPESMVFHAHNYSILGIFQKYFDTGVIWNELNYFKNNDSQFRSEGISYLKAGISFLACKKCMIWIPCFITHTAAGYIGLILGKHANKLRPSVRKLFSKYGT